MVLLRTDPGGKLSSASDVRAMARYLGMLVCRLLTKGQTWVDRGAARLTAEDATRPNRLRFDQFRNRRGDDLHPLLLRKLACGVAISS